MNGYEFAASMCRAGKRECRVVLRSPPAARARRAVPSSGYVLVNIEPVLS